MGDPRESPSGGPASVTHGWLPGVRVLRGYDRSWLRGDLLAGLAVAAYLVPQVMAYAEIAGLPAASGLAAACGSLLVYAVLGSSRQLSVGPESTTALMTAVAVAPLAAGDPARYGALAAGLAVVVGLLCLLARLARAGVLADLLSKPVLVGYLTGVAVNMIVSQLGKLTGVDGGRATRCRPSSSRSWPGSTGSTSRRSCSPALLVFLLVGARLRPHWPIPLIGMLIAAGAVALFSLQRYGIAVVGSAPPRRSPRGCPLGLDDWLALLLPAVGIAVVGYSDNMLTARSFAGRKGQNVDGNAELVALGGGEPGGGPAARVPGEQQRQPDLDRRRAGQPHPAALAGRGPGGRRDPGVRPGRARQLPERRAGRGGHLRRRAADRRGGVPADRQVPSQRADDRPGHRGSGDRRSGCSTGCSPPSPCPSSSCCSGWLARTTPCSGSCPASPACTTSTTTRMPNRFPAWSSTATTPRCASPTPSTSAPPRWLRRSAAAGQPVRWFVLNAEANVELDVTAAEAVDALISELRRRDIVFAMARVKQDLRELLDRAGLIEEIGADRMFPTLPTAVAAYRAAEPEG